MERRAEAMRGSEEEAQQPALRIPTPPPSRNWRGRELHRLQHLFVYLVEFVEVARATAARLHWYYIGRGDAMKGIRCSAVLNVISGLSYG